MKKLFQLIALCCLVSCGSHAPQMERKVKIWNGAPEEAGICRISSAKIKKNIERDFTQYNQHVKIIPLPYIKAVHEDPKEAECLQATDLKFEKYACLTFEDLGVLYDYIEKLSYSCKKW